MTAVALLVLTISAFLVMFGASRLAWRLALIAGALVLCTAFLDTALMNAGASWQRFSENVHAPLGLICPILLGYSAAIVALLTRWWTKTAAMRDPEATERERTRRRGRMPAPPPPPTGTWIQ